MFQDLLPQQAPLVLSTSMFSVGELRSCQCWDVDEVPYYGLPCDGAGKYDALASVMLRSMVEGDKILSMDTLDWPEECNSMLQEWQLHG